MEEERPTSVQQQASKQCRLEQEKGRLGAPSHIVARQAGPSQESEGENGRKRGLCMLLTSGTAVHIDGDSRQGGGKKGGARDQLGRAGASKVQ